MRILHNSIAYTFTGLQVQFQAGHGHKHPFLVFEHGDHKIHTKPERLHGELATWEGEYTLHVESRADHAAGTPFRVTAFEHHMVAPDQPIAEGTFIVTANTFGPQQVNVVLTNKKGYQKGTAVFVLNIGSRSEVWSGELGSPKGAAQGGYMAQGPIAVAASSAYSMSQPMSAQQGYMPAQQGYQAHASQGGQRGSPAQSQGPSSPHSLLPQGRGSIVYGPSGGYQQQDQSFYTAQGYQGMQQAQRASSSSSMSSGQVSPPKGYPPQQYQDAAVMNRSISVSSAMNMGQQGPPSPVGVPPSLGQQYFTHIEERPVTKEVVTYVQENHPVAKQYVVETRYTGEEHEVGGTAQQQILGHHERIIAAPPVMQQSNTASSNATTSYNYGPPPPQQFSRAAQQQASVSRSMASNRNMGISSSHQMSPAPGSRQYFSQVEERPVTKEVVTYVQERHPVAKQYVVEARYTGEEHELAGAAQQQVVGHKERYILGVPINYANNDLYQ
ncbi:hypothetical protein WJX77_000085 [Trebouxia sp. C0004]